MQCEFKGDRQVRLDASTATHLYRIAQEGITNAVKHGHVSRVIVNLSVADRQLTLSVSDDGIGLPEKLPEDRGLGFRVMASRAGMIGGTFTAKNNSEGGAIVTCQLGLNSSGGKR
jgi:signal transduction histidine kinase